MDIIPASIAALIPLVSIVWLGFVVWAGEQRKEKEAFYRNELLKKIIDSPSGSTQSVLELVRYQEREAKIRRREGLKMAGLILIAAGIGLAVFLAILKPELDKPIWAVGLLPLLIGIAFFIYVRYMAPPIDQ
jgi:hypothetical protein